MTLIVNKPPDELVWPEDFVGRIVCGDSLTVLKTMPDQVVQVCTTSPPFWGLRDYGTATWESGDLGCDHKNYASVPSGTSDSHSSEQQSRQGMLKPYHDVCGRCGAVRIDKQLGLESTPEEYVTKMVEVFREVHRVLRDDGTLWLNPGDSYASGWSCERRNVVGAGSVPIAQRANRLSGGLKEKDLVGTPWLVAFALRADGWYLRSDIIWSKPNPMPESVTDRPTKAHEYLFLLAKSQKYYYDADAVRETGADTEYTRERYKYKPSARSAERMNPGVSEKGDAFATHFGFGTRNKRSVWTVTTQPFPEAHFATFPEKLIEPCILAGSPEGGIVLDPFFGSGTVGKRSKELSRKWIGIDLNPDYCAIAEDRLRQEELF